MAVRGGRDAQAEHARGAPWKQIAVLLPSCPSCPQADQVADDVKPSMSHVDSSSSRQVVRAVLISSDDDGTPIARLQVKLIMETMHTHASTTCGRKAKPCLYVTERSNQDHDGHARWRKQASTQDHLVFASALHGLGCVNRSTVASTYLLRSDLQDHEVGWRLYMLAIGNTARTHGPLH